MRTLQLSRYSTICRWCKMWITKGSDFIECFTIYVPGSSAMETYWSHPHEMCLTPTLPVSAKQMAMPLNRISIIDSQYPVFTPRESGDNKSHFNSAPQAATTPIPSSKTQRSVTSAPPDMPEFVSVPRKDENHNSLVPKLHPKSTKFQVSDSVRSERSELTDPAGLAAIRADVETVMPNQSVWSRGSPCEDRRGTTTYAVNVSNRPIMLCVHHNRL